MVEKLFDEVLVHNTVSGSLEHLGKKDAILRICRENVIPTIPVETSDLHRCYAEGRPASAPEADPFIAP
jgi:hypothetical protein